MHPLPWLTWAFSQHDNLRVSLIQWLTFPGANVTQRHEDEEVVSLLTPDYESSVATIPPYFMGQSTPRFKERGHRFHPIRRVTMNVWPSLIC